MGSTKLCCFGEKGIMCDCERTGQAVFDGTEQDQGIHRMGAGGRSAICFTEILGKIKIWDQPHNYTKFGQSFIMKIIKIIATIVTFYG